jgi:hypothetical protein
VSTRDKSETSLSQTSSDETSPSDDKWKKLNSHQSVLDGFDWLYWALALSTV